MEIVPLDVKCYTTAQTFAFDEVNPRTWQLKHKVVTAAPLDLHSIYLPLASKTFAKMCPKQDVVSVKTTMIGTVGLGLCLDDRRDTVISIEAGALLQVIGQGDEDPAANLPGNWACGHCFTICNGTWRGCCTEHRLWTAILVSEGMEVKTPYSIPVIRGWFHEQVLADLMACIGKETVVDIAHCVAEGGFDGAPDLVTWTSGELQCYEVKSSNDTLRDNQVQMMRRLTSLGISCKLICPESAAKRFRSINIVEDDSD